MSSCAILYSNSVNWVTQAVSPPRHCGGYSSRLFLLGRVGPVLDTHSSVDPFTEQVGVATVTGILLDHVHEHLAYGDLLVLVR